MCGRFDTTHLAWRDIHDQLSGWGEVRPTNHEIEPNADVRPTTEQLVIRQEEGAFVADRMRWGLVPFWWGGKRLKPSARGAGDGFKLTTINAKAETVATAAAYKGAFARRRCLVPASAWYEWTGEKGSQTKHRFSRKDGAILMFAGLWDRAELSDVGPVESFTIVTQPAGAPLNGYHDRAPVILDPDEWNLWMDLEADVSRLLLPEKPDRFLIENAV